MYMCLPEMEVPIMHTGECDHIRENGNRAVLSNSSICLVLKWIS